VLRLFTTLVFTLLIAAFSTGHAWSGTPLCTTLTFEESMLAAPIQKIECSTDGSVLWGAHITQIKRSVDYGANWTVVKTFSRGVLNFRSLFVDSNDNLFIAHDDMGVLVKGVWAGGDTLTCTDVLTYDCEECSDANDCSGFWQMAEDSAGNLFVGEYNGNLVDGDTCAVVWKSTDSGTNWSRIRWAQGARHVHFCAVNPANDDLYVSVGDAAAQNELLKSTDAGATFTSIYTADCWAQPIGMAFTAAGRVMGSDCGSGAGHANGPYRTADDATFKECYTFAGTEDNFVWMLAEDPAGVLIAGTVGGGHGADSNDFRLYGSADDGETWCTLKDFADNDNWKGVQWLSQRSDDQGYSYYTVTEDDGSGVDTYRYRVVQTPHIRMLRGLYRPRQHMALGRSRGGRR